MTIPPTNGVNSNSTAAANAGKARSSTPSPASDTAVPSANTQSSDNVSLSTTGQQFSKFAAELSNSPAEDPERVASVRASLNSGQYAIDPDAIAAKLLDQDSNF